MDNAKNENVFWVALKFAIIAFLSIMLLDFSGVDAAKANIFSFDNFSLSILILLSICMYSFDNMIKGIALWFKDKNNKPLDN